MDADTWISSCAARLQRHWPQVGEDDLAHLAQALWADRQWRAMDPPAAAERWLQALQGLDTQGCGVSEAADERGGPIPLHTRARSAAAPARRETGECR